MTSRISEVIASISGVSSSICKPSLSQLHSIPGFYLVRAVARPGSLLQSTFRILHALGVGLGELLARRGPVAYPVTFGTSPRQGWWYRSDACLLTIDRRPGFSNPVGGRRERWEMPARSRDQDRTAVTLPRRLLEELSEADSLVRRKRWAEARDLLESLAQRYPRQVPVLSALVNLYYDLQDMPGYQHACERLIRLVPDDPDLTLGLAGAYLRNLYPVLAMRTFRRFLERWPDHPRA